MVLWRGSALGFCLRREGECCPRDFGSRFGKSNSGENVLIMSHVKGGLGLLALSDRGIVQDDIHQCDFSSWFLFHEETTIVWP